MVDFLKQTSGNIAGHQLIIHFYFILNNRNI